MPEENEPRYEVLVGNVGCVLRTDDLEVANRLYKGYVEISKHGTGRAGGEEVAILDRLDNEVIRSYEPK